MTTTLRESIGTRNIKIINEFYLGLSYTQLSVKYGVSVSMVKRLIKADEVQNGSRQREKLPDDQRKLENKKVLSTQHAYIGVLVTRYMDANKLTPTAFGMLVALSRYEVRAITMGVYDLTLSTIQRLSTVLGVPVSQLIHREEIRAYA